MLSPLPRRSVWAYCFAHFTQPYQPSPKWQSGRPAHRPFRGLLGVHFRYGLHTPAVTVYRDTLTRGFSHFVTSMTAPVASGWSGCRVGLAPTGKRRLVTAHTRSGHRREAQEEFFRLGNDLMRRTILVRIVRRLIPNIRFGTESYPEKIARRLRAFN